MVACEKSLDYLNGAWSLHSAQGIYCCVSLNQRTHTHSVTLFERFHFCTTVAAPETEVKADKEEKRGGEVIFRHREEVTRMIMRKGLQILSNWMKGSLQRRPSPTNRLTIMKLFLWETKNHGWFKKKPQHFHCWFSVDEWKYLFGNYILNRIINNVRM